jgi:hypothetical protein
MSYIDTSCDVAYVIVVMSYMDTSSDVAHAIVVTSYMDTSCVLETDPEVLSRIVDIRKGHLTLREENLRFNIKKII